MRWLVALAVCWLMASGARADVQRFALIIGNNTGAGNDAQLAYAETDARKVYTVLRELGGFQPLDMVLLQGEDARTIRQAVIAMNDRIRNTAAGPGRETLLFVYYSGHADAGALRVGDDRIELSELSQLVRGSAATFRLMVMDACRSGAVTRLKGGKMIQSFALPQQAALPGEGLAFLTASAPSEDAQESDEIRGSFFTHALVSGLLGAADVDGDGSVVLEEVYRYAYDATLRATSRTAYGLQHPSFEYDYRGRGTLVLTQPGAADAKRGSLHLPRGFDFLVLRDSSDGPVVAEVSSGDSARALSLAGGTYFLRGRRPGLLLEGYVALPAYRQLDVDPATLQRVEYARMVRKGARGATWAHALDFGPTTQNRAPALLGACWGAALGYAIEFEQLSLGARIAACHEQRENDLLRTSTMEYDASLAALRAWDLAYVTLAAGATAGATIAHQRFDTLGRAPNRTSAAPYLGLITQATADLHGPLFVRLEFRAATEFASEQRNAMSDPKLAVTVSLRAAVLMGVYLGATQR